MPPPTPEPDEPAFNGTRDVVSIHGFDSPNFEVPSHRIIWIKAGTGRYTFGEAVQPVEPGDVLMLAPGERAIHFPKDQDVHLRVVSFTAPDRFMTSSHRVFAGRDRRHRLLTEILNDLHACKTDRRDALLRIAIELFDEAEKETRTPVDPKLQAAVQRIDENPHLNISVSELARQCDYSESHFRRLFRSVLGVTPKQYIKKTKMDYALYLLSEENLAVKDVAATLGYNNAFEFSKQFKTVFGMPPSKMARSRS